MTSTHIGIVAVSAAILGPHDHPQISMHTYPLAEYMRHIDAGRWDATAQLLLASADTLTAGGAELLICPDNTAHQALDLVRDRSAAPWLHIAEEVAALASARGFTRLGILGTRYLMEGPVYPSKLSPRGIACVIPDAADRDRVNGIIFGDLVYGRCTEGDRRYFQQLIESLGARGCDAVVLGCTEMPLLIMEAQSPLPAIDSTRTLARAALREATRGVSR